MTAVSIAPDGSAVLMVFPPEVFNRPLRHPTPAG
jgi:hypothetical protein